MVNCQSYITKETLHVNLMRCFICNILDQPFFFKILYERKLPGDISTVHAIASVLAAAQKYMRDQLVS